jgi:hypothetical protein
MINKITRIHSRVLPKQIAYVLVLLYVVFSLNNAICSQSLEVHIPANFADFRTFISRVFAREWIQVINI